MNESLLKIRHEHSSKDYPHLSLKDGEYVELEFRRATICHVLIWVAVLFTSILLTVLLALFNSETTLSALFAAADSKGFINLIGIVLYAIIFLGGLIASRVHAGNRLYVTNKRAIQYEMISLFSTSVNIIELTRIEDVSFRQNGLFQHLFGIGTIRMSTVGDETTYTFRSVYKPTPGEIQSLTDLVGNAKNKEISSKNN